MLNTIFFDIFSENTFIKRETGYKTSSFALDSSLTGCVLLFQLDFSSNVNHLWHPCPSHFFSILGFRSIRL